MPEPVSLAPAPGDYRRAAALMLHHARQDNEGVSAVFSETAETGSPAQLIVALLSVFEAAQPALLTEEGQAWLAGVVANFARQQNIR